MLRSFLIILSVFSVLLLSGCSFREAYERGNQAYAKGDYHAAFKNYLYAAQHNVAEAQYAVGYLYFYGIGTKQDNSRGVQWIIRASRYSQRARDAIDLIHEDRPLLPWAFKLKNNEQKHTKRYLPKACVISVHCEDHS